MPADLVVFGEDWGAHPSSTQHLISHLKRDRRVLWVNSIGLRRPRLTFRDFGRMARKLRAMGQTTMPTAAGEPTVINPRVLPLPGNAIARSLNRRLLGGRLRATMAERGFNRPILWTSLPTAVDMVGAIDARAVVYYCGDDFGSLAGVDHRAVTMLEAELAERADLILAASARLAEKFPAHKTRLLSHGVDAVGFQTPLPRPADLPAGKPIAGFYGSIAEWLDVELMADVASRLSHWNFVLIGPVQTDVTKLERLGNVHFLGAKAHRALPAYVQHWQVSLLPFRDSPQIRACNPLKLREYLAVGKPVVATDFPALDGYREVVRTAACAANFCDAITLASLDLPRGCDASDFGSGIRDWSDVHALTRPREERQQQVDGESWDARAGQVAAWLDAL
ncbi:MAG: glycosyltransferase [Gammaproteobacteria bacterium]|nr:glycosyltransferase [Gammaproteobacteria bacterium]MDX2459138.1 glycosyltransferase [Gammaproteobacteria bacterium]